MTQPMFEQPTTTAELTPAAAAIVERWTRPAPADPEDRRRRRSIESIADWLRVGPTTSWSVIDLADASLSIAISRRHPESTGTAVVGAGAGSGARSQLVAAGVDGRVGVATCDPRVDPLPPASWTIVAGGLRGISEADRTQLLANVRRSLPADGVLIVIDEILDESDRISGSAESDVLEPLVDGAPYRGYTAAEFDGWSRAAGFAASEPLFVDDGLPFDVAVAYRRAC